MPTPKLPDATLLRVRELLMDGKNYREIVEATGVSFGTVSKIKQEIAAELPPPDPAKVERAKSEERERRRVYAEAVREQAFRSFLAETMKDVAEPPFRPPPSAKVPSARGHQRFPLLHLSDWHFEETVRSESVLGLNEYGIEVACRRVYRVIQAFRALKKHTEGGGGFRWPELTVALNGDFLTGTLHGLERHSDARNVVRATRACGQLIGLALRDLAADFQKVKVVGTVGNHGRMPDDRKVPTKDPTRNFDWIAYTYAQAYLSNVPNVEFVLPDAYGAVYPVGGHTVFQGHGNFIKQQLGIVGYGMRRFVSNLAANLNAAGVPLKYAIFGHFHSANSAEFAGVTAFIGPSLIGTQEYGFLSGGSVNRPAQQVYIFDRDLGHVSTENLYGDGPHFDGTYEVQV